MLENIKAIQDLRVVLVEEIVSLRAGKTTAANVNAVTNATGKIFSSVKLEMEYNKLIGQTPNIPFIEITPKPKALDKPREEDKKK